MGSFVIYVLLIICLIYWVEHPGLSLTNSLNIRKNPGEDLENWLKGFNGSHRQGEVVSSRLPTYKFYTEIVEIILNLARKMGGTYQDSLLYLREGLQSDRQFEKKIKEMLMGIWLQMGMMLVLTWGFIAAALTLVEVKMSFIKLSLILCWQFTGLLLLPFILKSLRKHFFGDIGKLWKMFYILKSLYRVPLPRTEVFTIAGVKEIKSIHQKSLQHIVEKLKEACQKSLQFGGHYEEDLRYLMEELRFQEKWHFELFEKRLVVVKLGLLAIFFLPSYLAFIFLLLGDLLSLM